MGGRYLIAFISNEKPYETKYGREFGKNSLYSILRNDRYIGVYTYNKGQENEIRIEDGAPRIIQQEVWQRAQRRIASRKRNAAYKAKHDYLLSGMLECGLCGSSLCGRSAGDNLYYYNCSKRDRTHTCNLPCVRADKIEKSVMVSLSKYLTPTEAQIAEMLAVVQDSFHNREDNVKLKQELLGVERKINNIIDSIADTDDKEARRSLLAKLPELKDRKQLLTDNLNRVPIVPTRDECEQFLRNFFDIYKKEPSEQKAILKRFVQRIVVRSDTQFDVIFCIPLVAGEGLEPTTSGL